MRGRVKHEALEAAACRRDLYRLMRPADVCVLGGLAVDTEMGDLGAVVNERDFARKCLELCPGEAEVDRRGISVHERDASARVLG